MVLSSCGCFQWLIEVQQLGWDLNYNILLADLKRLFLIPFWRRGTGLGPFPRGEEAAVAAQLLCWSTPPEVCAWLLHSFVCLRFPLVSAAWGFSSPLSIPPLLPGRGFLQVDFSFHQISLKPKLTLRPCRCCSRAQFLQGFFFFAVLRTWPVLALLRLSLWTGQVGLKCGNSGTWRLLGKLRNSTTRIHDFWGEGSLEFLVALT